MLGDEDHLNRLTAHMPLADPPRNSESSAGSEPLDDPPANNELDPPAANQGPRTPFENTDDEASVQALTRFDLSHYARSRVSPEARKILNPRLIAKVEARERLLRSAFAIAEKAHGLNASNFAVFSFQIDRLLRLEREFAIVQSEIGEINCTVNPRERADLLMAQEDFENISESAMEPFYACKAEAEKADKAAVLRATERAAINAPRPHASSEARQSKHSHIKLPPLQLPVFRGDLSDWRNFKNLFEVAVHNQQHLSGGEKLTYLISRLEGDPLRRVKNFSPSEENYRAAWALLCDYYDSERRHLSTHYKALQELPPVRTRADIPSFLTSLQEHVHALKALQVDTEGMEPFLVQLILSRFAPEVKDRFEDFRDDPHLFPTFREIEKYLKRESLKTLDTPPPAQSASGQKSRAPAPAAKVFTAQSDDQVEPEPSGRRKNRNKGSQAASCPHHCHAAVTQPNSNPLPSNRVESAPLNPFPQAPRSPPTGPRPANPAPPNPAFVPRGGRNAAPAPPSSPCRWCNSNTHSVFSCGQLRSLPVADRQRQAMARNLCLNCLSSDHSHERCPSYRKCLFCEHKYAENRHHTLLCPMNPAVAPRADYQPRQQGAPRTNAVFPSGLRGGSNAPSAQFPAANGQGLEPGAPINGRDSPVASSAPTDNGTAPPWQGCANATTAQRMPYFPMSHASEADFSAESSPRRAILLPTSLVQLRAPNGYCITARALIDSGATHCLLSSRCAQLLHLKPTGQVSSISGIGDTNVNVQGVVEATLESRHGQVFRENQSWIVAKRLTGTLPPEPVSPELRSLFPVERLADPNFDVPGPIDCLIGWDLLEGLFYGNYVSTGHGATYIDSFFGIVFGGLAFARSLPEPRSAPQPVVSLTTVPLPEQLERFWAIESLPNAPKHSPDEQAAIDHFEKTTVLLPEGRFEVRLPFKKNRPMLGDSRVQAQRRFAALERRFQRDELFRKLYTEMMEEHRELRYLEPFPMNCTLPVEHYFLAHHGVLKESSASTKLRVVYDASAKSSSGVSLNDVLYPGPKLQTNIWTVLTNFRLHAVAISCDIRQMYLQIFIHPEDQCYQLVLWRTEKAKPVEILVMNRVSFGENSSPFIAIACLHKLAAIFGSEYPRAAEALRSAFYIDDLATGAATVESAKSLLWEVIKLLGMANFTPHKFFSSHPEVLEGLPLDKVAAPRLRFDDPDNPMFGVLGVSWVAAGDFFTYEINNKHHARSKRGIVSQVASLYDPLGWIAPVILRGKRFIQCCWASKLGWDDEIPDEMWQRWTEFYQRLPALSDVKIPRCLVLDRALSVQCHIFCDAAETGYGAVCFVRSAPSPSDPARVSLLASKTRVAPLSRVSIPRLELCAADLSSVLLEAYLPQLDEYYKIEQIFAWSDSTITLHWIQTPAHLLKTFVANRVARIQRMDPRVSWNHVAGTENPADLCSRGVEPAELLANPLWWSGPPWLGQPQDSWPTPLTLDSPPPEAELELKHDAIVVAAAPPRSSIPVYSTWRRTLGVFARILRWRYNAHPTREKLKGPLSLEEFAAAEIWIIKIIQNDAFSEDIARVKAGEICAKPLRYLTPFLDPEGVMRVGGRLQRAAAAFEFIHPAVLSSRHPVTSLIVKHYHFSNLHPAPTALHSLISQRFWIVAGRRLIRKVVHECIRCFRFKPTNQVPLMGDLPTPRVIPNPPFWHCGVDYCGPFLVKESFMKFAPNLKLYLAIFVCFTTKAVHIEVAGDLSTEEFIAALHRFTSRRNVPNTIYSDCGTNFVGADNLFAENIDLKHPRITEFSREYNVRFMTNPPGAPHMGGLWESAVKSAKYLLKREIYLRTLLRPEFETLCCRVEAILNSRPLSPRSSDPNDLNPLTPGHFLTGRPLRCIAQPAIDPREFNRVQHWSLVELMTQEFWKRWREEYLISLHSRKKWFKDHPNLVVGKIVIINDPDVPPQVWKMGRVVAVFPGQDGVVRCAEVRTANGSVLKRPVHKLFPLPEQE